MPDQTKDNHFEKEEEPTTFDIKIIKPTGGLTEDQSILPKAPLVEPTTGRNKDFEKTL